jgi:RND family efflux transporter MFP subunit
VTPVVEDRLDTTVRLQGELSDFESVALYSRVQGYIEEVRVDRGSVVKKGQALVLLSAPDLVAHLAEAESQAQADASTYASLKEAAATPGAVAQHDLEIAEDKVASSRARVESLRALEDYLTLRAPFDGVIAERNVHPGALVGPPAGGDAAPLLRIEQVSRLRLTVAVPEADVGAVTPGGKAEFVVSAWPGERFSGTIARIAHVVDPKTRTMPVELDVANGDARLAAGMFADVLWPVRRASASLWVPNTALVQTADRTYVDRVKDGVVEIVPVRRGVALANRIEVFGPLGKADVVLLHGTEELRDGARVEVQQAPRKQ